ncbi:WD40/YVTN/BNR-like repeat-containing protein [Leisingera aquaemixtae]|uniref:WD40/YVTN/BNR-like repeat-containing protein n=1 Tax=Leisingera aquaemixtae TaxID=1396826 RepID=UPI0021A28DD9|nr:hypothetical protein [Leisingera aquaemixtae]
MERSRTLKKSPDATGGGHPGTLRRRMFLTMTGSTFIAALLPGRTAQATGYAASAVTFSGQSVVVAGDGVRSVDVSTGTAAGLTATDRPIRALANHPDHPDRLFAAPAGGGIARSDDGGRVWRSSSNGLPDAQVTALAVAAEAPGTVYAAVAGDGLWLGEDAGRTWSFVMDRPWIEEAEQDVLALASVNLASGMGGIWLYAGTEKGLTRVPDCFCRWQDVVAGDAMDALVSGAAPPPEAPLPEGEPVLALVSAHTAPEQLYAALPSGLWASTDGGATWQRRSSLHARALAVAPADPGHIAAATDTELKLSRDGGVNWATLAAL